MQTYYRKPINGQFLPRSRAERIAHQRTGRVLAPGFRPTPEHDLINNGGKTLQHLSYCNFYVAGNAWAQGDIKSIDDALEKVMSDPDLNNVMVQYFHNQPITATFKESRKLAGDAPEQVTKNDAEDLIRQMHTQKALDGFDLNSTVFNLLLPGGTILTDGTDGSERSKITPHMKVHDKQGGKLSIAKPEGKKSQLDVEDEEGIKEAASSIDGLGGFHGSVHINDATVYYAIGVFSERLPDGTNNGIPVFDQPWKNVVATFCHELNEARTDPDVADVDGKGPGVLGWVSARGEECGDFPVFEAQPLTRVFKEVPLTNGADKVPIQLMYSNAVHGPEFPFA